MLPLHKLSSKKLHKPEEVFPNRPVPAAGWPVLVATPPDPPNAVHSTHQFHFKEHITLHRLDLSIYRM